MTINWFTIFAQVFNFLLLLFILKVVLYKPIFRFMKARRDGIEKKIKEAEKRIKEGEARKLEYDKKIEAFEEEKKKRKTKLLSEMADKKEEYLEKMKRETERARDKLSKQIVRNREKIIENVNKIVAKKFVKFAESIFGSLADKSTEEKMVNLFIVKLGTLTKKKVFDLSRVIAKNKGVVNVSTAFALSKKNEKVLSDAIGKAKIKFRKIKFDVNPELIIGVEMNAGNSYVTWNVKEILKGMGTELG